MSTSTATERAGTVTVPVAASQVVVFTTGSAPFASAGVSEKPRPARSPTVCVVASGDALNTTSAPSSSGSTSSPSRSSITMTITPGSASAPPFGNDTFCSMRSAEPRRSRSTSERTRSMSSAAASAEAMSDAAGSSAGFASSGAMIGHFSPLSASIGSPEPNVDSCPVQSMRLNQSPEL